MERRFRERRRELEKKAEADPWDFLPETHDDRYNPADFEIPPLWECLNDSATDVRFTMRRKGEDAIFDKVAATIGSTHLFPYYQLLLIAERDITISGWASEWVVWQKA